MHSYSYIFRYLAKNSYFQTSIEGVNGLCVPVALDESSGLKE